MTWLIASMGNSPGVLTEAIWYLEVQKDTPVDRLTCVGTQASKAEAERLLLAPGGALERLRRRLRKPEDWPEINWEMEPLGAMDNRDLAEALAMDRAMRRAVRRAQDKGEGPVVACMSGGRKTMSSSLQQAMTFLARPGDWAFHILLRLPEGIEEQTVMKSGFGFPGDPGLPAYSEVGVDAFEVPIVRLRDFALGHRLNNLLDEGMIMALQKAVDRATAIPRLRLCLTSRRLAVAWGGEPFSWIGERVSIQQMLMLGAWIRSGEPVRREEAAGPLEDMLLLLRKHRIIGSTEEEELDGVVGKWLENSKTFGPIKTALQESLMDLDPAFERFTIKSRWGKNGPLGFADEVYGMKLVEMQIDI